MIKHARPRSRVLPISASHEPRCQCCLDFFTPIKGPGQAGVICIDKGKCPGE